MPSISNSLASRDIAYLIHPQTDLARHVDNGPHIIVRGQGVHIYDDRGKEYLEGASGLWCANLGFGVERLARVAYEAMKNIGYYHIYRSASHEAAIELAEKLIDMAPVPMSKVLFQCSGSEANDAAIKLVWYYWHQMGKPKKRKIISRVGSYHGSTCAAVSLTGKPEMHADFGLPFDNFIHAEFPHHYRFAREGESEAEFSGRMADGLERLILGEGPDTVAAFWAEPIMGAGGAVLPPDGYFKAIQEVLKKYDILFVADEVICGFGRTGHWWGSQAFDLTPDMITCAKGLSAGLSPISALIVNERIFQSMLSESRKHGLFAHGSTYAGHPVSAAVAVETLKIYEEMDIVGHVRTVAPHFAKRLNDLEYHPLIGNAGGCGLIGGAEIVGDKVRRSAFPQSFQISSKIDAALRKHGIILRLIGNRIAFAPPLIISDEQIDEMFARTRLALDEVYENLVLPTGN